MHDPKAFRPVGPSHATSHAQACCARLRASTEDGAHAVVVPASGAHPGIDASTWQAVLRSPVSWRRSKQAASPAPSSPKPTPIATGATRRIQNDPSTRSDPGPTTTRLGPSGFRVQLTTAKVAITPAPVQEPTATQSQTRTGTR
jgi:hypothetical protein